MKNESFNRPRIGCPRFKCGDSVIFLFDRGQGKMDEYEGIIEIVDGFGTYEQMMEPSYDIVIDSEGQKTLCKHVRESMILAKSSGKLLKE